ncbi:hypothetical protein BJY01DRAFT_160483 [Aspergillus pseudoustus]|uniref:HotDog domain-containing protein n=1 Tax=Aspergillus pseudoustus TaxID=1810923 RepID=A0ABR4KA57_9EURO
MHLTATIRPSRPLTKHLRALRFSSSSSSTASTIAASFLDRFQSLGPQIRTQTLDPNQLSLLSLTLNRPSLFPSSLPLSSTTTDAPATNVTDTEIAAGTPLPPGYHLVYFTPAFLETELGADGTDTSYNPSHPFTRRMWAGGEVSWPRDASGGAVNPLRVGQKVTETTRVLSAEPKIAKKTGEEMVVVGVEKEFANEGGVAVVDRRNWVFRKALPSPTSSTTASLSSTLPPPSPPTPLPASCTTTSSGNTHTRTLTQTPVTLFRFSALTFNPHKIHYSLPWARDVEGHRDVVVHGPLNLISILDLWRDLRRADGSDGSLDALYPERISYRATSPLYAGDEYRIVLEEGEAKKGVVEILTPEGKVGMKAEIVGV